MRSETERDITSVSLSVTARVNPGVRSPACLHKHEMPGSGASQSTGLDNLKRNILKRYSDLDYDSFVGLMGRRNAGEMHDIFVGLMGRRNSEPDNGPWRREYPERRGIFLNKCRLR
ncbi:hypothetical protein GBF38_015212 [Nibea albiflora]|uniref:Uncharacterized protein n=1 Tax=Nibea albiflora TaxID=240163 RepID=A0ACB7EL93_NIBAL|nr:hypothetical protein GBF38_015212 [Nibea albiflora]